MTFQLGKKHAIEDETVREETFNRWREASARAQLEKQESDSLSPSALAPETGSPGSGQEQQLEIEMSAPNLAGVPVKTSSTVAAPAMEEVKMDNVRPVAWPDPRATISLTKEVDHSTPSQSKPTQATAPQITTPQTVDPQVVIAQSKPSQIAATVTLSSSEIFSAAPEQSAAPERTVPLAPSNGAPVVRRIQTSNFQTTQIQASAPAASNVKPLQQPQGRSTTSKLAQFVSSGLTATGLLGSHAPKPAAPQMRTTEVLRKIEEIPLEVERRSPISETPLSADEDIRRRYGSNIRSALGPGTIIEGTFSFDSPVCIEGTLIGEVRSNSVLIVGSQATVNARVKVGSLIICGTVKGDVEAEEIVEIKNGGVLEGDVVSERFAIEDGGYFQGRCTPTSLSIPAKKVVMDETLSTNRHRAAMMAEPESAESIAEKWTID